jgi:hypothetical protein
LVSALYIYPKMKVEKLYFQFMEVRLSDISTLWLATSHTVQKVFFIMLRSPVIMWPVGSYMNGELAQEDIKLYLIMMVIYIVSVSTFDFAQNIIQLLIRSWSYTFEMDDVIRASFYFISNLLLQYIYIYILFSVLY